MADKHLTEVEWKKFAKGRDLKDGALLKALAGLDRATTGADRVATLTEIEKQSAIVRKAGKGDKALSDYLDELDKTLKQRLAAAKAEQSKAERKGGKDDSQDESEDDGPAVLTTGLGSLLKQVVRGLPMQAMIVTDGKQYGVLLSRRALSPGRSKLVKDYLGLGASRPPILGQCIFEANALTFVVQSQAAGLAKKIKQALLDQTERRWKVRVRGEAPDDIDEDLEAEAEVGHEDSQAQAEEVRTSVEETGRPGGDEERRIRERLAGFEAGMEELREAAGPPASELRALRERLERQLRDGESAGSGLVLERIERILVEAQEERERFHARLKELMGGYVAALRDAQGQLAALEKALKDSGDGELRLIGDAGLAWILGDHGPQLAAAIGALAKAGSAERAGAADRALQVVGAYLDHLEASQEIAACDGNDLGVDVSIRGTLTFALGELGQLLAEV